MTRGAGQTEHVKQGHLAEHIAEHLLHELALQPRRERVEELLALQVARLVLVVEPAYVCI